MYISPPAEEGFNYTIDVFHDYGMAWLESVAGSGPFFLYMRLGPDFALHGRLHLCVCVCVCETLLPRDSLLYNTCRGTQHVTGTVQRSYQWHGKRGLIILLYLQQVSQAPELARLEQEFLAYNIFTFDSCERCAILSAAVHVAILCTHVSLCSDVPICSCLNLRSKIFYV